MRKKLFKHIFYMIVAFCFMSAGALALTMKTKTNSAYAADTSSTEIVNENIPDYFRAKQYTGEDENTSSLIDSNIFMYSNDESLKLDFWTNGDFNTSVSDIYKYAYYPTPDSSHISTFNFFRINTIGLSINGVAQDINFGNYVIDSQLSFPIRDTITLQKFEMNFGAESATEENHFFKIVDNSNNVIEGVYSLTINYVLFTCLDGKTDLTEENITDQNVTLNYKFYVVAKDNYLTNDAPNIERNNFDKEVLTSTSLIYDYYLYSNYSSEAPVAEADEKTNKVPYITYDYTRYEVQINKEQANKSSVQSLLYDIETKDVVSVGDNIIHFEIDENTKETKVSFYDVGNYVVTYNEILVLDNKGELITHHEKHSLTGIAERTKKSLIYVYGYQANFTDMDGALDENNVRPIGEMKLYDWENERFERSADITSAFLNSNDSYSQASGNTSFVVSNVARYIETSGITPQKTNQTPIKFTQNATLSNVINSYIYTTKKHSSNYEATSETLNDKTLYKTRFIGQADGAVGEYIYIIAYTFNNYYSSASTLSATTIFYQVFYFEINTTLPSIEVTDSDGNEVRDFINKDVFVYDTTQENPYNKDVEVRVYAQNFNGGLLTKYGGSSGIAYNNLLENGADHVVLEDSAHYTIRLYFKNEITSTNILFNSKTGYFRDIYFTIDKTPVENIKASNVEEILNSTNYTVVSPLDAGTFTTNQNIVISWDNKTSGARTYAYYRYFKIDNTQYYSSREDYTSAVIERMLFTNAGGNSFLPINYLLDMKADVNNPWTEYKGNSLAGVEAGTISSEYVLSDGGLYILDVFDAAGNHSFAVFMIDYTTPIFALYDSEENTYTIPTGSTYISNASTLFWSKYKAFYIKNFNSTLFTAYTPSSDLETLMTRLRADDLYKNNSNNFDDAYKIYCALYTTIKSTDYMHYLTCDIPTDDAAVENYTNMYMTIPVVPTYYYLNDRNVFEAKTATTFREAIPADREMVYQVLIRDASNTKYVAGSSRTSQIQYTQYYSASQKISVSFDSSKFAINYTYTDGSKTIVEELTSNNVIVEVVDGKNTKTTYLNPTRLEKPFYISFTPTQIEGDAKIQVESVIIKYYAYKEVHEVVDGITYFWYTLSENATQIPVYEFNTFGESTESISEPIRLNYDNITMPGKYEITRVYKTGGEYTYNENDYFSRTFILYVDRNDVISNPELLSDDEGNSHLESLLGGDVFVSMYDNGENADLVVTFPNSYQGNTEGSSLYNTGTPRTILTTNMFPVRVYVPRYKYTTYATKIVNEEEGYRFDVNSNETMNIYDADKNVANIPEYKLYAEIYKDGLNSTNLMARTATSNSVTENTISYNTLTGFLTFRKLDGTELNYLSQSGIYYIKIYQGWLGTEIGINKYLQSITFCFEIQNPTPNFTASTISHESLNSVAGTGAIKEIYYTNQSRVELSWTKGSDYITDIDIDNIVLKVGNTTLPTSDVWVPGYEPSAETCTARLDLSKVGVYTNDGSVDITMQYKNHDARFYQTITKRIYVDLSAPYTNVSNLVNASLAGNFIPSLSERTLRTCYTANMEETTSRSNTSYNVSNSNNTGNFGFYSYMVGQDYLQTLRNSKTYLTYIRQFAENDGTSSKYSQEEMQETLPLEFLPSNFTEIADTRISLEADKYYEVVEMDMAKNMTIYTIYISSYETKDGEKNNLISYLDGSGNEQSYTIDDYNETKSYAGAIHNIYSKIGFQLESLNYFGDVWAQFKLVSTSSTGASTTSYFMLTPWDKTHAYSFAGSSVRAVSISSLIDGAINSRYKHSITFFNRQNGTTETFYINTRNTDLYASLTDSQTREFIKFTAPTDASINNTTLASTYLTGLKIYANNEQLYSQTQRLGFASLWTSPDEKILIARNTAEGSILFEINPALGFASNTKILYEYTNNYGQVYTEIHFYKETVIKQEISSENDLYAYYTTDGTLFYITRDGFQYTYNPAKYSLRIYDYVAGNKSEEESTFVEMTPRQNADGTTTATFNSTRDTSSYDDMFALDILNDERLVKSIFFRLYYYLPSKNLSQTAANLPGQFKLLDASRNNITQSITDPTPGEDAGYFSEVTLMYSLADSFIPVRYSISTDKTNWTEVSSGSIFKNNSESMMTHYLKIWYDEMYIPNEYGSADYLFEIVPEEQIYQFNLSSLTSTFWVEKTIDGITTIVNKSDTIFKTANGAQYSNHYIVNLSYADKDAVQIKTNQEQDIVATRISVYDSTGAAVETISGRESVASELWKISNENSTTPNIPAFSTFIVITYIPTSEDFVKKFYTYNSNGIIDTSINLISAIEKSFVVSQDNSTITKIELLWSKYYGIVQNEINITISKDGFVLKPTIYTREINGEQFNYCYLTYSGKYIISFRDNAGNVQKFKYKESQTDKFKFIFLKDVPFTITYTNPETEEVETSLPIKQAIYNGDVSLNIDKATRSDFYTTSGYPSLTVYRNGEKTSPTETLDANGKISYVFTRTGYYEYYFTAKSNLPDIGEIRQEKYQFTIINANEFRYSYIYNQYSNYYIEKVEKDGVDITGRLLKILGVNTILVDQKEYMVELPLSYLDEKTGAGTYMITINSNERYFKSETNQTKWTYQIAIKVGSAPISVSIAEGKATTKDVSVTFNKANIYREMGECRVRIIYYDDEGKYRGEKYSLSIDKDSAGSAATTITSDDPGTYFVQVVAPSGNLLYSYRVEKTEPMNVASIIAIVVSAIVVIIVVIIVYRLRKKISVK